MIMKKRILKYRQSIQNTLILLFLAGTPFYILLYFKIHDYITYTSEIKKAKVYAEEFSKEISPPKKFEDIAINDINPVIKGETSLIYDKMFDAENGIDSCYSEQDLDLYLKRLIFSFAVSYGYDVANNSEILKKLNEENHYNVRLLSYNGFLCNPSMLVKYLENGYFVPDEEEKFDKYIYNDNYILQDYDRCVDVYGISEADRLFDNYFSEIDYYYKAAIFQGSEIQEAMKGNIGIKIRTELNDERQKIIYIAIPCSLIEDVVSDYILLFSVRFYPFVDKTSSFGAIILTFFIILLAIIYSVIVHFRIYVPIIKLSQEAVGVIDQRGKVVKTDFKSSRINNELGDISRAMSYLITRLNDKIHYIETFSSDVVHEFKNPLAAIRSSVDIMNDSSLSEKEKLALYNSINDEIHHLEILLNDIRGISKVENQDNEEGKENVPVGMLAENIISRIKTNYPEVSYNLNCENKEKTFSIRPENLDRILENLIDNAASFVVTEPKKQINVIIRFEDYLSKKSYLVLIVEDSGHGVTKGEEEKIFTRFYSHRNDEQKKNHSGLGLSTVKAIVDSLNGKISIERSEELGGAKFIIELPV